jgi:hypothetical protein
MNKNEQKERSLHTGRKAFENNRKGKSDNPDNFATG